MKVIKIDHLGIAVRSIEAAAELYTKVLGLPCAGEELVTDQKVRTAFFPIGDTEVELLESTAPDGAIAKFIEKRGEGLHHIAFKVEDIDSALKELKENGIQLIDHAPRTGAGKKRMAFLHPKNTWGVLLELCEEMRP